MAAIHGKISQVIGPVVDVHFDLESAEQQELPRIHDALEVARPGGGVLVIEVQQHIGEDTVRCVAMDSTDGLQRGMEATDTHAPISMPVGAQIRGRVLNVTGEAIDGLGGFSKEGALPIHREPPKFEELTTSQEVRKDRTHQGTHQQHCQETQRLLHFRRRGRTDPRGQRPLARND